MTLLLDVVLLTPPASATVAQTLPRVGQTATDTVRSRGQITGDQTLPGIGQTATATSGATGADFSSDFSSDFSGGPATPPPPARDAITAQALGQVGQTATAVDAQDTARVDQTLGPLGQTATAQKKRDAVAAQTLGALGQQAKGTLGLRPPPPITDQDRPLAFPIEWPKRVLRPQSIMFQLKNRSTSGGVNVLGDEQVVASSADRWRAKLSTRIHKPEQILAYRWVMAQAGGRVGTWLIPPCSGYYVGGWVGDDGSVTVLPFPRGRVPFSDSSTFADSGEFDTVMVQALVTTGASARARSITVQMQNKAPPPIPGTFFSIGQSLYTVVSALLPVGGTQSTTPFSDSTTFSDHTEFGGPNVLDPYGPTVLQFRPGLRAAVTAGTVVEFSKPACLMRLAGDDAGELDLDMLRFGNVSLDFVEVIP